MSLTQAGGTYSITATNTRLDLAGGMVPLIINDGADDVHLSFQDRDATTADFALKRGEWVGTQHPVEAINLICAEGESASVRVLAYRPVRWAP
jgi:hypothetical protein